MLRHHQHVQRLELVLRLVENEALNPEDVVDLKDLVEDYLERNQDDFDEFGEVEDMYDGLNLAGGVLRTSTRPTLNLLPVLRALSASMSIHPEVESCSDLSSSACSQ